MDRFEKAKKVIERKVLENKAKAEKLVGEQRTLRDETFKRRRTMPYEQYTTNIATADKILEYVRDLNKETVGLQVAMRILMSIERGVEDGEE